MEPVLPNLTRDTGSQAEAVRKPARRRSVVPTQEQAGIGAAPGVERRTAIASIGAWLARLPGGPDAAPNRREAWMARREARDLVARATERAEASADLVRRAMNRVEAGPDPEAVPPGELTTLPTGVPNVHAFAGLRLPAGADPVLDYPALVLEARIPGASAYAPETRVPAAVMTPLRGPHALVGPTTAARARRATDARSAAPLGRELAGEPVAQAARRLVDAPQPEADVPSARRRAPGLPDLAFVSAKIVEAARNAGNLLASPQELVAACEHSLRRAAGLIDEPAHGPTADRALAASASRAPQPPAEGPLLTAPLEARSVRRARRETPFVGREPAAMLPPVMTAGSGLPTSPGADVLPDLATLVAAGEAAEASIPVPAWVRGDERTLLLEIPGPGEAPEGAELFRLFRQNVDGLQTLADDSNRRPWWNFAAR